MRWIKDYNSFILLPLSNPLLSLPSSTFANPPHSHHSYSSRCIFLNGIYLIYSVFVYTQSTLPFDVSDSQDVWQIDLMYLSWHQWHIFTFNIVSNSCWELCTKLTMTSSNVMRIHFLFATACHWDCCHLCLSAIVPENHNSSSLSLAL